MPDWHYVAVHSHVAEVGSTEEQCVQTFDITGSGNWIPCCAANFPASYRVCFVAGSAMEATKIRSGARILRTSVMVLLRTPAAVRTAPVASKLSRRLTVREEC